MDNRREQRAVVDRELIEPARLFGFRVRIWVGPANQPENGWRVPLGSERSKVLAGPRRSSLPDAVGREISAERINDARTRLRVIHIQRVAVQCRYLRRSRAPDAAASAFTIRSMAASTRFRTPASNVRTLSS